MPSCHVFFERLDRVWAENAISFLGGSERYRLLTTVIRATTGLINPRLTRGCLFASGHHGPTVDTFERKRFLLSLYYQWFRSCTILVRALRSFAADVIRFGLY